MPSIWSVVVCVSEAPNVGMLQYTNSYQLLGSSFTSQRLSFSPDNSQIRCSGGTTIMSKSVKTLRKKATLLQICVGAHAPILTSGLSVLRLLSLPDRRAPSMITNLSGKERHWPHIPIPKHSGENGTLDILKKTGLLTPIPC